MENEHELSYETLTRVYLGSYEHYKSVEAEVEHPEPGFELQGAKMHEVGRLCDEYAWWKITRRCWNTHVLAAAAIGTKGEMWLQFGPKRCCSRCGNCKKVGHQTRDCRTAIAPNTQRALVGNQQGIICYECERPGHFRKDCPKLRNQNRGNQTRNKNGNKTGNQTGGNEATVKAYSIGGGGTNPDSNVVTGTFLLNNCYASMLFDSGSDRSFVSNTFSALLDVTPTTLYTIYAVELTDGRISETNIVLRGCTCRIPY
ncbi:putative reverse transcriptase domain-containing protein [Tanacetum coccineum]